MLDLDKSREKSLTLMALTILERMLLDSFKDSISTLNDPVVGFTNNIIKNMKIALIVAVKKKMSIVFVNTFDSLYSFGSLAMLVTIVNNTKGTTKVNIKLTNKSPNGLMYSIVLVEEKTPKIVPKIRENTIEIVNKYFFKKIINNHPT